jgi:hypothetical protein
MGKRVRRGRGQWETVIQKQEKSGLSAQEFCRRESIGPASFYKWRGRIQKGTSGGAAGSTEALQTAFIDMGRIGSSDIRRSGDGANSFLVTLNFGDGFTLTVQRG